MNPTTTATTATGNASTTTSSSSSSMPDLSRARPIMLERMMSTRLTSNVHGRRRASSPQPSTSASPASHGSREPSASKRGRFVGSPAPRLADPMPTASSVSDAPDNEAFKDVTLGFKANVMRLWIRKSAVVIDFASSPSSDGSKLLKAEWESLCEARDTIEHHMKSRDTSGEDVRLWILLKDRHNDVCYLTVKPFHGQMYVDIRDFWHPYGPDGGLRRTKRGVTLNREGWNTLVQEMDTMDELWHDATVYLAAQSGVKRAPSTLVDTEEYSQLVILDD